MSSSMVEQNDVRVVRAVTAAESVAEPGDGKSWLASLGAVGAAFGASLCCIGPLLFVTFGVGAGLASTFQPLRPLFTTLTVLSLVVGFYMVYARKPKVQAADACCAPGDACARSSDRTRDKVILWAATGLAVALWSFTYWSTILI